MKASVRAEGITLGRAGKRNFYNSIYHPVAILPFHYELAWVHSIFGDNIVQAFEIKLLQSRPKGAFARARDVDGIKDCRGTSATPTLLRAALLGCLAFSHLRTQRSFEPKPKF